MSGASGSEACADRCADGCAAAAAVACAEHGIKADMQTPKPRTRRISEQPRAEEGRMHTCHREQMMLQNCASPVTIASVASVKALLFPSSVKLARSPTNVTALPNAITAAMRWQVTYVDSRIVQVNMMPTLVHVARPSRKLNNGSSRVYSRSTMGTIVSTPMMAHMLDRTLLSRTAEMCDLEDSR